MLNIIQKLPSHVPFFYLIDRICMSTWIILVISLFNLQNRKAGYSIAYEAYPMEYESFSISITLEEISWDTKFLILQLSLCFYKYSSLWKRNHILIQHFLPFLGFDQEYFGVNGNKTKTQGEGGSAEVSLLIVELARNQWQIHAHTSSVSKCFISSRGWKTDFPFGLPLIIPPRPAWVTSSSMSSSSSPSSSISSQSSFCQHYSNTYYNNITSQFTCWIDGRSIDVTSFTHAEACSCISIKTWANRDRICMKCCRT